MALLQLWNINMASGNPSSLTSILPGGAGGNAVAGTTPVPMVGLPTAEPLDRSCNDQTPAYVAANGAIQGNLVVLPYGLPAGITSNSGGGYWSLSQFYARQHAPLSYGIVNVSQNSGIGQELFVCCNGPVEALCTTTTNAIAVGTWLCADGLGNLTAFQPPSAAPTPTITPVGTSGSTTYSYGLVAVGADGTVSTITTATTAGGNATLSNSNYNQISWTSVADGSTYIIVRTSSAGTPSTVGVIGQVSAADGTFNDTGLAIEPNTSATQFFQRLAAPSAPTVTTSGTAGTTSYSYKITAVAPNGVYSAESTAGTVSTGNATLGAVNYNHITWSAVTGAVLYVIDRTASAGTPSTLGTIGYFSVTPGSSPTYAFNDTGLAATAYTAVTAPFATPPAGSVLAISLGVLAASTSTPTLVNVWCGGF